MDYEAGESMDESAWEFSAGNPSQILAACAAVADSAGVVRVLQS